MQVDNAQKQMVFKEYSSIQLSTRDKFVNKIKEQGYDKGNIVWVCSQKIHGSNFSIHFTQNTVRYGRRTDFLTEDIPLPCDTPQKYFKESFYDAKNLVKKFHNKLQIVYKHVNSIYPDLKQIIIYGEYFGGNWPQNQPGFVKIQQKPVQKGVCYSPQHQFMAFDVKLITEKFIRWANVTDIPKLLQNNILSVPVYAKGTFEQIYNIQTKIDSTIPELLGLHRLKNNIIEGMVIRPDSNLNLQEFNERVILKKKNAQFQQRVSQPKNKQKKPKNEKPVDPVLLPFIECLKQYLNFNRIESVVSKYPDVKDRNKLKNQIVKDILTDAGKDQWKQPQEPELTKKVMQEFDKIVIKELNNYFVKH